MATVLSHRLRSAAFVGVLALLLVPAAAHAGLVAGDTVDLGPVSALGGADLARDGSGVVAWTRNDGDGDHVWVAPLDAGTGGAHQRVDAGQGGNASQVQAAAASRGRYAVVWVNGGTLWSAVRTGTGQPLGPPTPIWSAGPAGVASNPSLDLSIHGVGYVAFTVSGAGRSADVRVARLARTDATWLLLGSPVDINPAADAGVASEKPRVIALADGTGVVAWGENGVGGYPHVWERRVVRTDLGVVPQEVGVPSLDGHAGGAADSVDLAASDDSGYAEIAVRQLFDDAGAPRARSFVRQLVGSALDPAVALDGLFFPAAEGSALPRLAMNSAGEGIGVASRELSGLVTATTLQHDRWETPSVLSPVAGAGVAVAAPAIGRAGNGVVSWLSGAGTAGASVLARERANGAWQAAASLSRPEWGTVPNLDGAGPVAAADYNGDAIVVFLQGDAGSRRVVVAALDQPPGRPDLGQVRESSNRRPFLRWSAVSEPWGPVTYAVTIDDRAIGQTTGLGAKAPADLSIGRHSWRVIAVDRRGQTAASGIGRFKIVKPKRPAKAKPPAKPKPPAKSKRPVKPKRRAR